MKLLFLSTLRLWKDLSTTCNCYFGTNISGSKTIDVIVSSFRIDRILATGLGIGRRQSEYSLLGGLVKLNGITVTKKSVEVKEGDTIDRVLTEKSTGTNYVLGRVHLKEVHQTTNKGNYKVTLIRTKLLNIDKSEYKKDFEDTPSYYD